MDWIRQGVGRVQVWGNYGGYLPTASGPDGTQRIGYDRATETLEVTDLTSPQFRFLIPLATPTRPTGTVDRTLLLTGHRCVFGGMPHLGERCPLTSCPLEDDDVPEELYPHLSEFRLVDGYPCANADTAVWMYTAADIPSFLLVLRVERTEPTAILPLLWKTDAVAAMAAFIENHATDAAIALIESGTATAARLFDVLDVYLRHWLMVPPDLAVALVERDPALRERMFNEARDAWTPASVCLTRQLERRDESDRVALLAFLCGMRRLEQQQAVPELDLCLIGETVQSLHCLQPYTPLAEVRCGYKKK